MKKKAFILIFAAVLTAAVLCGCSGRTVSDPFTDFYGDIQARCALDIQGEVSEIVFLRSGGELKAEFAAPKTLQGLVIKETEEGITIGFGDLSIPMDENAALILCLCKDAFSPFYTEMTNIGSSETDGEKLTVIESGEFIYTFYSDGKPKSVGGVYRGRQFLIRIDSLVSLKDVSNEALKGKG